MTEDDDNVFWIWTEQERVFSSAQAKRKNYLYNTMELMKERGTKFKLCIVQVYA